MHGKRYINVCQPCLWLSSENCGSESRDYPLAILSHDPLVELQTVLSDSEEVLLELRSTYVVGHQYQVSQLQDFSKEVVW